MPNYSIQQSQKKEDSNVIKYWRKNPKSIEKFQFVHHFLPKSEKRSRADLLDNKAIFIYCAIILALTAAFRFVPKIAPGVLGYASDITISDLLKYTNKKRVENGVSNLRLNAKLSAAAEKKAQDMFKDGYWAHVAPDGAEPWDFILSEGYDYIYAGENLAKNFSTSKEVVEAWFKSPTHKSNLIGANYDEVGFAVVNGVMGGYETTLVVQMFGRPRQPSMVASVLEEESVIEKSMEQAGSTSTVEGAGSESGGGSPEEIQPLEQEGEEVVVVSPEKGPIVDITAATKGISLAFGGFVGSLLTIDILYSRKKGIRKFTGQTVAHLTLLIASIVSIWFVLTPGLVI